VLTRESMQASSAVLAVVQKSSQTIPDLETTRVKFASDDKIMNIGIIIYASSQCSFTALLPSD